MGRTPKFRERLDTLERPTIFLHFLHLDKCSGNCSMRCSNFLHLTATDGGNAKGLLGTILALQVASPMTGEGVVVFVAP
jgi:hypothetical protein